MSWQKECEVGYYCTEQKKHACPPGTYGYLRASKARNDCAPCRSGFYCPSEPDRPTKVGEQIPCGVSHHFCPDQSAAPFTVSIRYYSLGNNSTLYRNKQEICPKGSYYENGMKYACPPGTFGQSTGLISKACSGFCPKGKYVKREQLNQLNVKKTHTLQKGGQSVYLVTTRNCERGEPGANLIGIAAINRVRMSNSNKVINLNIWCSIESQIKT